MCGIAGFWTPSSPLSDAGAALRRMTGAIAHRGPDAEGYWQDAEAGLYLGHRRLSIIDLSTAGSQPMVSASGRWVITFNGEIYNFQDVRAELEDDGVRFRGRSDTEVLVEAIDRWGVETAVRKSAGMFAFAVWDRQARRLILVRDRVGEKPLYYARHGRSVLFGSELKALRVHPDWRNDIDRSSVALFLRHNYIPAPYSIYTHVRKVRPGCIVTIEANRTQTERVYWSMADAAVQGCGSPFAGSPSEAIDELERRLSDVIREQMTSDVPVGAFLSGGVDSSLIVALMQKTGARRVKTFTIKFDEPSFDESDHAAAVGRHLGTDHTEVLMTAGDARGVIPSLPAIYDEPFSDSSQIPTYLVSQVARSEVKVSLSGDGGDEFFAGYPRYAQTLALRRRLAATPLVLRRLAAHALSAFPPGAWNRLMKSAPRALRRRGVLQGDGLHALSEVLRQETVESTYRRLVTHWPDPERVTGAAEHPTLLTELTAWPPAASPLHRLMYLDAVTYLPDDIFVKLDRASMAVGLESRVPLADHRIVEFAWSLPADLLFGHERGKFPLRGILERYVPTALTERPKKGFAVPLADWLRGPLRSWGEALLDRRRLDTEGFFDARVIRTKWEEFQSGAGPWHFLLWDVLTFQAWLECQ
jgi:asparagine synthase (glutamine-hydrolysing)